LPPAFDGQIWQWLAFIDPADGDESHDIEVDNPSQYTLELLADGTYVIQADCNRGGGNFSIDGSSLTLEPGFMTLAACPPESLSDRFVSLLVNVVTFVFDADGQLVLNLKLDAGDMIFAPVPTTTRKLTDTVWTLQSVTVRDARIGSEYDGEITAEFNDGQVNGSGGCNNYFGGYFIEEDQLTIDKLGSTLMSCGESRDKREREFLTGLEMVRSYQIEGDTLTLLDANQNTMIVMVAKDALE
jgi:heat shock protein HslJ